jgi:dTDP-4-amino-4,6-dideoxygalactose transaminase
VYNYYVIRVPDGGRDTLAAYLAERGIETAIYYLTPLHLQPAYRHLGYGPGDFPIAEAATREVLTLPVAPEIPIEAVREVAETIAAFFVEHGLRTLAQMEDS